MTQFLSTPVDKSLGATGAWTDIDLSGDVPTSATGAIFQVRNTHGSIAYQFGLRKKGSTDNRYKDIWYDSHVFCVVGVDANRKCQGKIENAVVDFHLVGYTEGDATLFTNAYDKSQSTTGVWSDLDLSSELPAGSVAAIFQIENVGGGASASWGLRKKGSTDDRYDDLWNPFQIYAIIGVDANRKCQFKIESTNVDFYLLGYLSSGTAETNGVDRSLGSTGSYTDITESSAPSGASGVFVDVVASSSVLYEYAAREKGASGDIYDSVGEKKASIFVGLDANKKWEGKISNTGVDFYTLGYFSPYVETKTKETTLGISIEETKTKTSSFGLSLEDTFTKASTLGLRLVTQPTKSSTLGIRSVLQSTKATSIGITLSGTNIKESSLGISIEESFTKASSLGLRLITQPTKASSLGVSLKETFTKDSSLGLSIKESLTKQSTLGLTIVETVTKESSLGLCMSEHAEERGFYYAKLGSTILTSIEKDSFRITEELNKIPSFEFEIANCTDNRTIIAAGITDVLTLYRRINDVDTLMFTGIINGDAIEYLSLERIRITGYASYIDLNWRFHQHLNSEDGETVDKVYTYTGSYVDKTTEANNDTINDVPLTFDSVNDALYIGQGEQFFGVQVKYSTAGIAADCFLRRRAGADCQQIRFFPNCSGISWATVVYEYSKGSGVWATLDVLDESRAFTEDPGTYFITIPHKPSDWAKDTVNGVKKFWIRARLSAGFYMDPPAIDRIKITNVDIYRVYYLDTAADTIMDDVLAGTDYSMDVTDACPSDTISIVAEYETKLRFIAGVANALTWDDGGDKRAYQWWVDTSKKVHFKQKRGATLGDITADLTILNNIEDYFNLSNRLHFLANYDGLNQLRAVIEDTPSQDTHEIREIAVLEERFNNYTPLKEAAQKAMTYTKAPLQKITATVTTKYWIDNAFEVGDTVTLHKDTWNVDSTAFQIVRADIGPRVTNVDMGISQEHLDGLKASLQRRLDITGIRMHGSTTLLQFGPETMNYQRVDATIVYPSKLKIEIPSDVRYIHKVLLSWTIGPYRASVGPNSSSVPPHNHDGYTGADGGHNHTGSTETATPHAHSFLDKDTGDKVLNHTHVIFEIDTADQVVTLTHLLVADYEGSGGAGHQHGQSAYTGNEPSGSLHTHSVPATGSPSSTSTALIGLTEGSSCASGYCVSAVATNTFGSAAHTHSNSDTGSGDHWHVLGGTTDKAPHQHEVGGTVGGHLVNDLHKHTIQGTVSGGVYDVGENWIHSHTIPDSDDGGGEARDIPSQASHNQHAVTSSETVEIATAFQIHEIPPSTTLELLVNGESIGADYVGDQTDIRIDGFLTTGTNSIEVQPIVGDNSKGGVTQFATGVLFIEAKKF